MNEKDDESKTESENEHTNSERRHSTSTTSTAKKENFETFVRRMLTKADSIYNLIAVYVWRFLEIHIYKTIIILVGIFCFNHVSLINLLLFSSTLLSLMLDKSNNNELRIHTMFSGFLQIWTCVFTVVTMIYQLEFISSPFVFNCSVS